MPGPAGSPVVGVPEPAADPPGRLVAPGLGVRLLLPVGPAAPAPRDGEAVRPGVDVVRPGVGAAVGAAVVRVGVAGPVAPAPAERDGPAPAPAERDGPAELDAPAEREAATDLETEADTDAETDRDGPALLPPRPPPPPNEHSDTSSKIRSTSTTAPTIAATRVAKGGRLACARLSDIGPSLSRL